MNKPIKVFHGTGSTRFEGKFSLPAYFTDNYDTAKAFGLGASDCGLDFDEEVPNELEPYILEVILKSGEIEEFLITDTQTKFLYSDAIYEDDIDEYSLDDEFDLYFDKDEFEFSTGFSIDKAERISFRRRKIEGFDEYGVGIFYLFPNKMKTIDVKGKIWDVDIQILINKAEKEGYDILKIKNIIEGGIMYPDNKPTTSYVVFNSDSIFTKKELLSDENL